MNLMAAAASEEVLLEHNRMRAWVDAESGQKCFMLFARSLSVIWANDEHQYWTWNIFKESRDEAIEVAGMSKVCWLDVSGRFKISDLTPGRAYEIVYVVKLLEEANGWEFPINLKLSLPNGQVQQRQVSLLWKPKGQWIELNVGNFVAEAGERGEVCFQLYEHGGHWKGGLIIKGVILKPAASSTLLQRAWVDAESGQKCFMLFARSLSVIWGNDEHQYWIWNIFQESRYEAIEVAELSKVCWLDVSGRFKISDLTPGRAYEIVYLFKLLEEADGWEFPINLKLSLPNGQVQERQVSLLRKPRGQWMELHVGNFVAEAGETGEVCFQFYEHGGHWKGGLIIKGVILKPAASSMLLQRAWVDAESGQKCFTLFARSLSVIWGNDEHQYWTWNIFLESRDEAIEVAELNKVCWLDVSGKFKISDFTPGRSYEIVYLVKLLEEAEGWEFPINLRLSLPNGQVQERQVSLLQKPRGQWMELNVGNFVAEAEETGEVCFQLYEHGRHWKGGLIIKGVILKPAASSMLLQRAWVDAESGQKCFMLFAKSLSVIWGNDEHQYWTWNIFVESRDEAIEAAKLNKVCWLDVGGRFKISDFTPGRAYEIVYIVKLLEEADGWEFPINLKLSLPNGQVQERQVSLLQKPRGQWMELNVGNFVAEAEETGEVCFQLYEHGEHWKRGLIIKGVILKPAASTVLLQRAWVDTESGQKCFMLFARSLSVIWGNDEHQYWTWNIFLESRDEAIEVAKLCKVCWLDVSGRFKISDLTPGKAYKIVYVVKLLEEANGWELPINLKLILPNGRVQERQVSVLQKPRGQWMELNVGNFLAEAGEKGEVCFQLYEHEGHWKQGLIVKGVILKPAASDNLEPNDVGMVQQRAWVDARSLNVIWGDERQYWIWKVVPETRDEAIEVAELIHVCWLDVSGRFQISELTPGSTYRIIYTVKLLEEAEGWEIPINLKLSHPNGHIQERQVSLLQKPRDKWIELNVGNFLVEAGETGEVFFQLYEHGGHWKEGLIIKGVILKPVASDNLEPNDVGMVQQRIWVHARSLSVIWGDEQQYWIWKDVPETRDGTIEVAELIHVCWLDVSGRFQISELTPGSTYRIIYIVKLPEEAEGWEIPINLKLSHPNGHIQECQVSLLQKPRDKWIELNVGNFLVEAGETGEVSFQLYEHGGHWKEGLIIKGVILKPVASDNLEPNDVGMVQQRIWVHARSLSVIWGDEQQYWIWKDVPETRDGTIEVAELINVCWLDVSGRFQISELIPGITYKVVYIVKLLEEAAGWELPINLKLSHPNGHIQERQVNLLQKPKEEWIELNVGNFLVEAGETGEVSFQLYEHGGHWKEGLIIKGVVLKPVASDNLEPDDVGMVQQRIWVHARSLSVIWGDEQQYWNWKVVPETRDEAIEVAELINVCWLDVSGRFRISELIPGITYEIVYIVKLLEDAEGWEIPINLKLSFPNGHIQERQVRLLQKPREEWVELNVGNFLVEAGETGEVRVQLYEHGGHWKGGLIIKGVILRTVAATENPDE